MTVAIFKCKDCGVLFAKKVKNDENIYHDCGLFRFSHNIKFIAVLP